VTDTDETPADISGNDRNVLDHMLRHMVAFVGAYRQTQQPHSKYAFAFTGFVIEYGAEWYICTAGHILEELDAALSKNQIEFTGRVLADYFGPHATNRMSIPFDYEDHKRVHVYNQGLDFALIQLQPLERQLLASNNILPFRFEGRTERPWEQYDGFCVVGFPKEDVKDDLSTSNSPVRVDVRPSLSAIKQLSAAPPGVQATPCHRFIGQILDPNNPKNFVGMSGGPLLGFKQASNGLDYWVIAIQSTWLEKDRVVFACPISVMLQEVANATA
jgi:hypothetical protein